MTAAEPAIAARPDLRRLLRLLQEREPDNPVASRRLVRHLFLNDALEELVRGVGPEICHAHADPECLHFIGSAALTLGDLKSAERYIAQAVAGGHKESCGLLAKTLKAMGKRAQAHAVAADALSEDPGDDAASQVIFSLMLEDGRHGELWDLCARLVAAGTWTARMVSAMALAAETADQMAQVRSLVARETWLTHAPLFRDSKQAAALGAALKDAGWTALPRSKATVGQGRRIEKLHRVVDGGVLNCLFHEVQAAVARYTQNREALLAAGSGNPMAALRPARPVLTSWAVAVAMDGQEDWHIHPDGWLSGVYYVDVPDLSRSPGPKAGHIEFGPYPLGPAAIDGVWPNFCFQPRTGDLLLFPSYFAHRTWPTQVAQDRICIAFDILRQGVEPPDFIEDGRAHALAPDDRLVRAAGAVCMDEAGITIAVDAQSGRYVTLDEVGAQVWRLLTKPCTIRELARALQGHYDAPEAEIARDVADFVSMLAACNLVRSA